HVARARGGLSTASHSDEVPWRRRTQGGIALPGVLHACGTRCARLVSDMGPEVRRVPCLRHTGLLAWPASGGSPKSSTRDVRTHRRRVALGGRMCLMGGGGYQHWGPEGCRGHVVAA